MNDFRTSMALSAAARMSESVVELGNLVHLIGADSQFGLGDLAVRVSRFERSIEMAIAAKVSMTDWTENDLDRQIHDVRDQVRLAWRAWVLEATVEDEQAVVNATLDKLVGWDSVTA